MTPTEFASKHQLTLVATRVNKRPLIDPTDWDNDARHWKTILYRPASTGEKADGIRPSFTIYFSQGSAHTKAPTVSDVIGAVSMDIQGAADRGFEEWAREYGYDTDSRKAERTFQAIEKQAKDLEEFLSGIPVEYNVFHEFVNTVEAD